MNLLGVALALTLTAKGPGLPKVAVADIADTTGQDAGKTRLLSQLIVSEVSQLQHFKVVDSAGIASVLGLEQQKRLLGCSEGSCVAELGGALGVDYILSSSLGRLGTRYRVDLKLVDAVHGVTLAAEGAFVDGGDDALGAALSHQVRAIFVQAKLVEPDRAANALALKSAPAVQPRTSNVPAYLLLGGGVLLGVVAGLVSIKASSDFQTLQTLSQGSSAGAFSSQQGTVRADDVAADVLFAGAAVAAGTGIYFLFTPTLDADKGAQVGVGGHF